MNIDLRWYKNEGVVQSRVGCPLCPGKDARIAELEAELAAAREDARKLESALRLALSILLTNDDDEAVEEYIEFLLSRYQPGGES